MYCLYDDFIFMLFSAMFRWLSREHETEHETERRWFSQHVSQITLKTNSSFWINMNTFSTLLFANLSNFLS